MKRIASLFFLFITLWGCDKKNSVVPIVEPPPVKPVIVLSITKDTTIKYGESAKVDYCIIGTTTSIKYNGSTIGSSGSIPLNTLLAGDVTLNFEAANKTAIDSKVIKITVGDWTTSTLGLVTYDSPWQLDSMDYIQNGVIVADINLQPEQKATKSCFMLDGKILSPVVNGVRTWLGNYSFLENHTRIMIGDQNQLIFSVTKTRLVLRKDVLYSGSPAIYQLTYARHELPN